MFKASYILNFQVSWPIGLKHDWLAILLQLPNLSRLCVDYSLCALLPAMLSLSTALLAMARDIAFRLKSRVHLLRGTAEVLKCIFGLMSEEAGQDSWIAPATTALITSKPHYYNLYIVENRRL